jgi:hypothetical protein
MRARARRKPRGFCNRFGDWMGFCPGLLNNAFMACAVLFPRRGPIVREFLPGGKNSTASSLAGPRGRGRGSWSDRRPPASSECEQPASRSAGPGEGPMECHPARFPGATVPPARARRRSPWPGGDRVPTPTTSVPSIAGLILRVIRTRRTLACTLLPSDTVRAQPLPLWPVRRRNSRYPILIGYRRKRLPEWPGRRLGLGQSPGEPYPPRLRAKFLGSGGATCPISGSCSGARQRILATCR